MMRAMGRAMGSLLALGLVALYRAGLMDFLTGGRLLALVPGGLGRCARAAWYRRTLRRFGDRVTVDWMTVLRTPDAEIGSDVFLGPSCWIGLATIGDRVLFGGHTVVLSGARQHGFDDPESSPAEQEGAVRRVTVGDEAWIGSGCTIMADVAAGTVVGAGSVVTRSYAPRQVLAGVPARVLRARGAARPPG